MVCSIPSFPAPTISQNFPKFMPTESVMPSNHHLLCCPLLLLPSTFPSIRVFSNESAVHIKWPKYWNFSISPFKVLMHGRSSKNKKKERESLTQEHLEPAPTGSETLEIRPLWIQGQTRMKSEILTNHCKGFLMAYWLSSPVSLTFNSVLYPHEVEFCTGQSHASQTRDVKYIPSLGSLC